MKVVLSGSFLRSLDRIASSRTFLGRDGLIRAPRRAFRRFYKPANVLQMPYLDVEYNEPSEMVLHAAFEAFCVLVEQEKVFEVVDFDPGPDENAPQAWYEQFCAETRRIGKEIRTLYDWWRKERPRRPDPWINRFEGKRHTNDADEWFVKDEEGRNVLAEFTPEYSKHLDECSAIELSYEEEDDAMLHRLVDIRKALWS